MRYAVASPWWSSDEWGVLNSYGPLFNLLAFLTPISVLAPKLLYAFAYVLFVTWIVVSYARDPPDDDVPWPANRRMAFESASLGRDRLCPPRRGRLRPVLLR